MMPQGVLYMFFVIFKKEDCGLLHVICFFFFFTKEHGRIKFVFMEVH